MLDVKLNKKPQRVFFSEVPHSVEVFSVELEFKAKLKDEGI